MIDPNELCHHGVKGMKWGHRKARVSSNTNGPRRGRHKEIASYEKQRYDYYSKKYGQGKNNTYSDSIHNRAQKAAASDARAKYTNYNAAQRASVVKSVAKMGATYAAAGLAVYGTYKVSKMAGSAAVSAGKNQLHKVMNAASVSKSIASGASIKGQPLYNAGLAIGAFGSDLKNRR